MRVFALRLFIFACIACLCACQTIREWEASQRKDREHLRESEQERASKFFCIFEKEHVKNKFMLTCEDYLPKGRPCPRGWRRVKGGCEGLVSRGKRPVFVSKEHKGALTVYCWNAGEIFCNKYSSGYRTYK